MVRVSEWGADLNLSLSLSSKRGNSRTSTGVSLSPRDFMRDLSFSFLKQNKNRMPFQPLILLGEGGGFPFAFLVKYSVRVRQ